MTVKGQGRCKIDGVSVGDVSINFFGRSGPALEAKYAYEDSESGVRRGHSSWSGGWSPQTYERLLALAESMERDICAVVFEEGATSDGGTVSDEDPEEQIRGL